MGLQEPQTFAEGITVASGEALQDGQEMVGATEDSHHAQEKQINASRPPGWSEETMSSVIFSQHKGEFNSKPSCWGFR